MEGTKGGGGYGGGSASAPAKASTSCGSLGDRKRFTIELRPAETTIVSWKKLSKDANKADRPLPVAEVPSNAHPALESRLAPPGQPAEDGEEDAPPASRFSAVIEKIERLYMGKHSSDEEDLNDVPPDDEYDTEDSFIDDAELDEYFQVDNSAIKHDGFFVNRGKLERINEPASLPNEQPKKRRRKDIEKFHGEGDGAHLANKHVKMGKKTTGNSMPSVGKCISDISHVVALPSMHSDMMKLHSRTNSSVARAKKRSVETKMFLDPSPCKILNGSSNQMEQRKTAQQKTGDLPSKYQGNRMEDGGQTSDHSLQRSHEHGKSQSGKVLNTADEMEQLLQLREKDSNTKRADPIVTEGKYPMQVLKTPPSYKKEGSSVRPKSTMLEKAIRELEKMVAESKPLTTEVPEAEVKQRRLPRDVKQKLAKVARLGASNGKISNELLNRLMGILGHWIQLRTLKRNLKDMVKLGLSAKKEKDDRSQLMKTEIAELIRMRMPLVKSKELEQEAGACGIKEIRFEDKEVIKRKYCMDAVLEDKICDLYDLYVDGLDDEDAGPQVRKLYAELAQLWPEGLMDNHGIKRAICRAKDRKRALYSRQKDQEKIKRKKLSTPKTEETARVEGNSAGQPQCIQEKLTATDAVKEEKVKGSNINETRTIDDPLKKKKKVKRNPELETGGAQNRKEGSASQGEDRHKSRKQQVSLPFVVDADPAASLPIPQASAPNLNKAVDA